MTFEITLSPKDYERYLSLMVGGAYDGKMKQSHHPDFKSTVMLSVAIILFMAGMLARTTPTGPAISGTAVGFCLAWGIMLLIQRLQLGQYRGKFAPGEDDPLFDRTTYTLEDGRIRWSTDSGQSSWSSKRLLKWVDDEELFLLFKSNREAHVFPKQQLGRDQQDFIRQWCSMHINPAPKTGDVR